MGARQDGCRVGQEDRYDGLFDTLLEAKVPIERWRQHYNTIRPHSAFGYRPGPEAWQSLRSPPQTHGASLLGGKTLT